ncbi:DNA (cytosine-5-)-methyltransferase [Stenotrophomonas maltophilia]|uniref:DNA (cytosine-5-)-methyltransferase n=1 Tax=Stenotrophomonas maltophilia TaxID=40324 RepID=UPI0029057B89|nr:DNA (cytosine-5-)-methyltransferase [Stenotrophomonas maltophilia]MCU1021014.1 DNA (cytosine-5-)-methyltransferase [Stenotrophomonas maltophilia]HDS1218639.1 DNA (cytosine-5-)-methyltransferase [Stenotrophomonas maltophilia]HDS1230854.1 DNA (cytosine-5-)-methyltransferase [Stenotrophomonas maltophilia]
MNAYELIDLSLQRFSPKEVAQALGVDPKTVRRWQLRETEPKPYIADAIRQRLLPFGEPPSGEGQFRFIDLFAGIGGIRTAFEKQGGRCVFTSEWDPYAVKTYKANFHDGPDHVFASDITKVHENDVPDHDVLLAGFPCQPFSIAGVSKKNSLGRPHGFSDKTQGTLFFDVARIIDAKRPRAFLLENVKNLMSHDKGRTFSTIIDVLQNELGYHVHYRVINGKHFGPQHRERIIIVGFREETPFTWEDLELPDFGISPRMGSVLHRQDGSEGEGQPYIDGPKGKVLDKYTLSDKLWDYLQNYAAKHRDKGNGFGFGLVTPESTCRTLSARYYKDGSEILISQGARKNPRRLTPRECARLMGFDDNFRIPVSDTRAYKQFGNSVVVPVISEVARIMVPHLVQQAASKPAKSAKKKAKG